MDGVTPENVSSVRWKESNSGQPGRTVPSVLCAVTNTVAGIDLVARGLYAHIHTQMTF